jgi:hypothetical protein
LVIYFLYSRHHSKLGKDDLVNKSPEVDTLIS